MRGGLQLGSGDCAGGCGVRLRMGRLRGFRAACSRALMSAISASSVVGRGRLTYDSDALIEEEGEEEEEEQEEEEEEEEKEGAGEQRLGGFGVYTTAHRGPGASVPTV